MEAKLELTDALINEIVESRLKERHAELLQQVEDVNEEKDKVLNQLDDIKADRLYYSYRTTLMGGVREEWHSIDNITNQLKKMKEDRDDALNALQNKEKALKEANEENIKLNNKITEIRSIDRGLMQDMCKKHNTYVEKVTTQTFFSRIYDGCTWELTQNDLQENHIHEEYVNKKEREW